MRSGMVMCTLAAFCGCERQENARNEAAHQAQAASSQPVHHDRSRGTRESARNDRQENVEPGRLEIVQNLELERYMGRWYEIARYPNIFQKGIVGVITTYTLQDDGTIRIDNYGRKKTLDGSVTTSQSTAEILEKGGGAIWRVKFFPMVSAPYWIIDLGPDYEYAVVGQPSRKYLWILGRESRLADSTYRSICERLEAQGYDPARLVRTPQPADDSETIDGSPCPIEIPATRAVRWGAGTCRHIYATCATVGR